MSKTVRCVPFVAFFLFFAPSVFADTLQVTFSASFGFPYSGESVSGSFLWNTQTEVLFDASVTSSGPVTFLPILQGAIFEPSGGSFPAGSLIFADMPDTTGTLNLQLNFADHLTVVPPLPPLPGSYSDFPGAPFFIVTVPSIQSQLTVTETPEPGLLTLLAFGGLSLAAALATKSCWSRNSTLRLSRS